MDVLAFAPLPVGITSTKVVLVVNPVPELLTLIEVITPFVITGVNCASLPEPETFKVGEEL